MLGASALLALAARQAPSVAAARALLERLGARSGDATLPWTSPRRSGWTYLPARRPGVAIGDLDAGQRAALERLLRTGLSEAGLAKVEGVMLLEGILGDLEALSFWRDPGAYPIVLFGDPGGPGPWAWRFEGHHLSVNLTNRVDGGVASTPLFFGANPARVPDGPYEGLRVLAAEEDLARELVTGLPPELRERAVISARAPSDILSRRDPAVPDLPREGVAAAELPAASRALLERLLAAYLDALAPEHAAAKRAALAAAGDAELRLAWAGATAPGEPHYYRIQGPTILIEYDNTQNGANHVHSVLRDPADDFGGAELLRAHYESSPHHRRERMAALLPSGE